MPTGLSAIQMALSHSLMVRSNTLTEVLLNRMDFMSMPMAIRLITRQVCLRLPMV